MVTPRRILCLSALLAVLLTASAGAAGEGSVPAAFWQEGTLYAFARLTEDPAGAGPGSPTPGRRYPTCCWWTAPTPWAGCPET